MGNRMRKHKSNANHKAIKRALPHWLGCLHGKRRRTLPPREVRGYGMLCSKAFARNPIDFFLHVHMHAGWNRPSYRDPRFEDDLDPFIGLRGARIPLSRHRLRR